MLPKEIKLLCSPVTLTYGRALLESDLIVIQDRPDPVPGILTYFPENVFDTALEAVSSAYRNAMGFLPMTSYNPYLTGRARSYRTVQSCSSSELFFSCS